jgi:hypothetical protein
MLLMQILLEYLLDIRNMVVTINTIYVATYP